MRTPARFVLDDMIGPVDGWTDGATWNGWACPHFSREQADAVVAAWNAFLARNQITTCAPAFYDAATDEYVWPVDTTDSRFDEEPEDRTGGTDRDGMRLYSIGAWSWTWSLDASDDDGCEQD